MKYSSLTWVVILYLFPYVSRGDIIIDGFSADLHDRFSNSNSFLLKDYDLSGIGQDPNGRWLTAISRNVVITAAHPQDSDFVYFYPGNDPTAAPVTRNVLSGMKVGSTDLFLAVLDANLPSTIAHYEFAREALSGTLPGADPPFPVNSAGSFEGLTAYLFGLSPVDHAAQHDQAVGQNKITGYSENVPFLGNTDNDSIIFEKDADGTANHVDYEAKFSGGDSGGPTFVVKDGRFILLGTNAFVYGFDKDEDRYDFTTEGDGSGINYTGNQAAAIDAFIALHAVPEPGAGVLVVLGIALMGWRRRRRKG